MNSSIKYMERELKNHDSSLFIQESRAGRFDIYRKSKLGCNPPHFIFSLTDTWNPKGKPVPWGIDVVLNRIKAHDMWRDDTFIERWITEHKKDEESKGRAFKNSVESFLYDFRGQFHRATNEINTSLLDKKVIRKEG